MRIRYYQIVVWFLVCIRANFFSGGLELIWPNESCLPLVYRDGGYAAMWLLFMYCFSCMSIIQCSLECRKSESELNCFCRLYVSNEIQSHYETSRYRGERIWRGEKEERISYRIVFACMEVLIVSSLSAICTCRTGYLQSPLISMM